MADRCGRPVRSAVGRETLRPRLPRWPRTSPRRYRERRRYHAAGVSRRISQVRRAMLPSPLNSEARPPGLKYFGATYAFTCVTARGLTHHPFDGLVGGLQSLGFPPPCHPSYGALALTPAGLTPAEHVSFLWTHC